MYGRQLAGSARFQRRTLAKPEVQLPLLIRKAGDWWVRLGTLACQIDLYNLPLNQLICLIAQPATSHGIDGLETGACLRGQGRAHEGWKSVRWRDGHSRRSATGLARAGRHCEVAAASLDPCARACSGDGGRGARAVELGVLCRTTKLAVSEPRGATSQG